MLSNLKERLELAAKLAEEGKTMEILLLLTDENYPLNLSPEDHLTTF